jgi:ribosomal protein L11 methyltransferase
MDYFSYAFDTQPEWREILLAWLSELPFDTFEETEEGWIAYLPEGNDQEAIESSLAALQEQTPFSYTINFIPAQNWNAVWEANFQPICVEDFCGIRAEFHPPFTGVTYELVIQPRMAFGTGHHETTYMMMAAMKDLPIMGARVFDYGCGTGILAILAAKMGATTIDAVDIEAEAAVNTRENAQINNVNNVNVYEGDLHAAPSGPFEIILANINRNVILNSLPALYAMTVKGGLLLVSGILEGDVEMVKEEAASAGFQFQQKWQRGAWAAMAFSA